jgi:hypothetical protein
MRLLEFSPAHNVIRVRTWSPTLGQFEADADSSSQFTLAVDLSASAEFEVLGSTCPREPRWPCRGRAAFPLPDTSGGWW